MDDKATHVADGGQPAQGVSFPSQTFDCPRCQSPADAEFYGPCPTCRDQLRATMGNEARKVETADYEPKMNVVPNQVATRD